MTNFRGNGKQPRLPQMAPPQQAQMAAVLATPFNDGQLAALIAGTIVAQNIQALTGGNLPAPQEGQPDWRMLVSPETAVKMAVSCIEAGRLIGETDYPATVRDRLYDTMNIQRPKTPEQETAEEEERRRLEDEQIERERAERTRRELSGESEPPASPPNLSLEG